MAKFVLADEVSRLDYDFGNGKSGTIPEPSPSMVNLFQTRFRDRFVDAGHATREELEDPDAAGRILARLSADEQDKMVRSLFEAIADVCSGEVSADDLEQVGHRGAGAFLGWLMGELNDPEGSSAATPRSLRAVSNG